MTSARVVREPLGVEDGDAPPGEPDQLPVGEVAQDLGGLP
jgi:hypothetical protein